MKIHEYQAKQILRKFGVNTPEGKVAQNAAEAFEIAKEFAGTVAVKAQIHAGGRGKGGGIKLARNPEEAEQCAAQLIGRKLMTPQTGPEGQLVQQVLIEKGLTIRKEFYLGITIDRSQRTPLLIGSDEGGVEIEEVAAKSPECILKVPVDLALGLQPFEARSLAFRLGFDSAMVGKVTQLMLAFYRAFEATDASLAEINPLVLTQEGELFALDAKMSFDDSGLYRQTEIRAMRDFLEEDPLEIQASRHGLNYIRLDGNVGCMVNGAGLAMATMDIIKLAGGNPANFLDVGGGASVDQVKNAFKILVSDEHVKAVLINIFGGIMRGDVIANGVVQAAKDLRVAVPVVVRLEGTNVEQGREIFKKADLHFNIAEGMAEAAQQVCALALEN